MAFAIRVLRVLALAALMVAIAPATIAAPRAPTAAESQELARLEQVFEAAFARDDWTAVAAALSAIVAIRERTLGPENPITLINMTQLGVVLQLGQKPAEAEAVFRRELAIRRRVEGDRSAGVAMAAANLGLALEGQGRFADAEPFHRLAVAAQAAVAGPQSAESGEARTTLAANLGRLGRSAEALAEAERARDIVVRTAGPESEKAASVYAVIGAQLVDLGRLADGEAQHRHALAIRQRRLGPSAEATLTSQNSLAIALTQQGRPAEAERLFRRTLEALRAGGAGRTVRAAEVLVNLATAVQKSGKAATAEPMLREALAILAAQAPPDHPSALNAAASLAACLSDLGRYAEAEPLARRAFDGRLRALGENHPDTAIAAGNLAGVIAGLGRDVEAELLYRRALAIAQASRGEDHPLTASTYANLAYNLANQGNFADAEALQRRALAIRTRVLGPDHPDTAENSASLGYVLQQEGDYAGADPLLREALAQLTRRYGAESLPAARLTNNLAANLDAQGRNADAAPLYSRALQTKRKLLGAEHPNTLLAQSNLAYSRFAQGDKAGAASLWRPVTEIQRRTYAADSPERVVPLDNLAMVLADQPTATREALALAREAAGIARRRRAAIVVGQAAGADATAQAQVRALSVDALRADPLVTSFVALIQVDWAAAQRDPVAADALRVEAFVAAQEIDVSQAGQAMARTAARVAAGRGPLATLAARQQELADSVVALDRAYAAALGRGDRASAQQLAAATTVAANELARIDAEIAQRFPQYRSLVAPGALDVAEVRRRLRPGEGLLLIVPSNGDLFSFAVTAEQVTWSRAPGRQATLKREIATLLCQVDFFTCATTRPYAPPGRAPFDRAAAWRLYRDLVAPVEPALAGVRTLYVTTAGALATLPLGLLVTAEPPPGDDGDPAVLARTPWFADRYALVSLPAVAALRTLDRPATGARSGFAGYGDPTLGAAVAAGAPVRGRGAPAPREAVFRAVGQGPPLADQALLRGLDPLPGTRRELMAMAQALSAPTSALHTGAADTERAVRTDPALGKARVIAFATHGLLPRELGRFDEPGLVFTPPARPTLEDDGLLAASEAAELRLDADWVILSACNTAGAESGAEALSGLARAFLYAGARALLASHWRVSDDATAVLTVETLRASGTTPSHAAALQVGMRAVRTGKRPDGGPISGWDPSWAHPMNWAPFVLIADRDQ